MNLWMGKFIETMPQFVNEGIHHTPVDTLFVKQGILPIFIVGAKICKLVSN